MQDSEEPLFFRGNGATECEDFVNTVNRYAWKSGKAEDPKWAAHFAMSCLSGKALRWSMQQDKNTRSDWDLLSVALLLEYTEDLEDKESELRSPAIPTAAAAPATELVRGISTLSSGPLSGRIRLDTDFASPVYVSWNAGSAGILTICSNPDDAIKVHWTPGSSRHLIRVLNPSVTKYDYLGVTHFSDDPRYSLFGPNSTASAALTFVTKPNAQGYVTSMRRNKKTGEPVSGKSRAAIWNILADSTIVMIVEDSGSQYAMTPLVGGENNSIYMVANCESYMAAFNLTATTCSRRTLVFEPV
ncbi:hypothetical protein M407DRAFT_244462 [Tulasnella calospora MUT 4182]|uniref:Uncharacterized protein n=1 Tax=Tulasnella calospora MUT 4182 TaxID=1051891 RepID=A0A0C3QG46_9AGAM|nr:hypothetical protein M407DRAFT_244462 [Tulasnella calospora MUT 4182]